MVSTATSFPASTWPREAIAVRRRPDRGSEAGWRAGELLQDAGLLIGLVYLLPFVILLVGAPIALALKALLWLAGAL